MNKARCLVVARILMWTGCTLVTAAVVLSLLELKPWRAHEIDLSDYSFSWNIEKSRAPDGWWNPRYTNSVEEARQAWEDRWQIGNRTYRTSDLMGRRI
jgi:hypothetical protein